MLSRLIVRWMMITNSKFEFKQLRYLLLFNLCHNLCFFPAYNFGCLLRVKKWSHFLKLLMVLNLNFEFYDILDYNILQYFRRSESLFLIQGHCRKNSILLEILVYINFKLVVRPSYFWVDKECFICPLKQKLLNYKIISNN